MVCQLQEYRVERDVVVDRMVAYYALDLPTLSLGIVIDKVQ